MTHPQRPQIAIVVPNTLAALGLSDILRRMMPGAEVCCFAHYADLAASPEAERFFHYFVAADELMAGAAYFLQRQPKTIVLLHGTDAGHLPQGFHTLNVLQGEKDLVRDIMEMARRSHSAHGAEPDAVRQARCETTQPEGPQLTPREREVLKGIVSGLINKQIAEALGVTLATVITHRKNLTEKLGTRSVAALTIYAVAHGLVRSEDI